MPGSYGSTPFKWNAAAGYQHVPFTGLYHIGAREYDPRTARWLQRDPIGQSSGDPNVYRYCGNDAVNLCDPDGLEPPGFREYVAAFFSRDTWSVGLSVGVKSVAHTFSWGFYDPGEEVKQHPGWQGSQGYANAGENILSLGKGQVRRSAMNMAKEKAKAQIKKTRAQIADELCLSPGNPLRKQTRSQLAKGLRSLEERIAEHEENLRRVSVDPMSFAKFKNADPRFRQRIIDSDIRHWKGELKNFREQIKTIQRLLGGSDD